MHMHTCVPPPQSVEVNGVTVVASPDAVLQAERRKKVCLTNYENIMAMKE